VKNRPLVIGHRGAMGHAPENTLASFELGWRMGADALECDVHLSKDRRLVVMHDESLDRTTSGSGLIQDHRWSEIRRLDAGGWFHRRFKGQHPLRLEDLLAWIRGKKARSGQPLKLVVEIKNEPVRYRGIAEAVANALRGREERVLVISFDHGAVKRVKVLSRKIFTGILFHQPLPDLEARVRWTRSDAVFPRWSLVTPALVRAARRKKWFVGTWTVNDPDAMKKMIRLGVDGAATNFPDRFVKLLS
jgi:glycerophosphoryl diester phosphodiesterase